jgi:hypothetical protein
VDAVVRAAHAGLEVQQGCSQHIERIVALGLGVWPEDTRVQLLERGFQILLGPLRQRDDRPLTLTTPILLHQRLERPDIRNR